MISDRHVLKAQTRRISAAHCLDLTRVSCWLTSLLFSVLTITTWTIILKAADFLSHSWEKFCIKIGTLKRFDGTFQNTANNSEKFATSNSHARELLLDPSRTRSNLVQVNILRRFNLRDDQTSGWPFSRKSMWGCEICNSARGQSILPFWLKPKRWHWLSRVYRAGEKQSIAPDPQKLWLLKLANFSNLQEFLTMTRKDLNFRAAKEVWRKTEKAV